MNTTATSLLPLPLCVAADAGTHIGRVGCCRIPYTALSAAAHRGQSHAWRLAREPRMLRDIVHKVEPCPRYGTFLHIPVTRAEARTKCTPHTRALHTQKRSNSSKTARVNKHARAESRILFLVFLSIDDLYTNLRKKNAGGAHLAYIVRVRTVGRG